MPDKTDEFPYVLKATYYSRDSLLVAVSQLPERIESGVTVIHNTDELLEHPASGHH